MPNVARYLTYLNERLPAMTDELERYVTIESGSREKAGVDRVGHEVARAFAELGFSIERIAEEACGDHLIARRAGGGSGRALALIHLDTVWPTGSLADNPFRIADGVVYGPGIRDMKGGWVVLLSALRALQDAGWDGLEQFTVFMTGDEQLGSPRGRPWIEREAHTADWALVMEPSRDDGALVTHRGLVGALSIDIHGVATHSTNRRNGVHTIAEAAHKILQLEALGDDDRGLIVSVGIIKGGSSRQYTAAHSWLSVDLRAPSNEEADELLAQIHEIAGESHVSGTRSIVSGGVTRPATSLLPGTERLLQLAQECGPAVGIDVRGVYARGGSDGNFTAALSVPTLDGLGIQGAGGTGLQENALLASIPPRAAMLAGIIEGLPALLPAE